MYRNQKKSFVKIRALLATPFSRAKNLGGPLGPKKNCLQIGVYCIQNDRLGHTVSTKQTVNWSEFVGLRYPGKCVDNIWPVCPWFKSAMDSKMVRIRNGFEPGTGVIINMHMHNRETLGSGTHSEWPGEIYLLNMPGLFGPVVKTSV